MLMLVCARQVGLAWNGIDAAAAIELLTLLSHGVGGTQHPPAGGSGGAVTGAKAPLKALDLSSNSFAVYADATSTNQVDQLALLKDKAAAKGVRVKLGHIYGHGLQ